MTTSLTIGEIYARPPLMPLWPDFGRGVCRFSESTTYLLAAQKRLPVETVRLGRKQFVRTADVLTWLHLPENSEAATGATATASDEHSNESTAKKTGEHS
ncbi:DNA-binding protein [Streptomyces sp. GMY02]|uniref:DNA-binding protein n=1 Tax=Streptomyces sp. GMY02 TaxID=1333528 RepID=UPI001C2C0FCA|nr:DNA-binding protein [Streptomyces sp. GMY02]QXE36945.1 DNA-binding protein [Streptomyces sp. GMY02]